LPLPPSNLQGMPAVPQGTRRGTGRRPRRGLLPILLPTALWQVVRVGIRMSSRFLRKALSNTVWSSLSSVTNAVLSLLVAGLTIRWLGLEEAGFVLFLQAIIGANRSVFSLGMNAGCLRFVSEAHRLGRRSDERPLL